MIGFTALVLALIFTVIATFTYGLEHFSRNKDGQPDRKSGRLYIVSVAMIILASVVLAYLILSDQFRYQYVYAYSQRDLSLFYKAAAFWAGQEGSFLLWALLHGLLGLILMRGKTAPAVMTVYGLLQTGLILMVIIKSPFMIITQTMTDGAGLNPLLQNLWMVVHPPILFLGYAALAAPFSMAIGFLLLGDYKSWIDKALPWSLAAWGALGIGIFMGGYWAYEVLGWGGYWAWDPVENSSLIPWLITGALVHFLIVAANRPMAVKPAYLAAIFAFGAALYGTFLTRSGVLSDFSTHSFSGQGIGGPLAAFVMVVLCAALVVLIIRWPALSVSEHSEPVATRGFVAVTGGVALCALAAIVVFGTSSPLVTVLLGNPQSVNQSFFNITSLPLAACILALIAAGSLIGWKKGPVPVKYIVIALSGLLAAALGLIYGLGNVLAVITLGLAGAAITAGLSGLRRGLSKPAALTHAGLGCLVIGIIISSAASETYVIGFAPGESYDYFGKSFTYNGDEDIPGDGGYIQKFTMDGQELNAVTRFDKAGKYSVHEPAINSSLTADIYVAPSLEHEHGATEVELIMDQPASALGVELTFTDFGMTGDNPDAAGVYALIDIDMDGLTDTLRVELKKIDGDYRAVPVTISNKYELKLLAVSVAENKVLLELADLNGETAGQVIVEISNKPLIMLVWLGTVVIAAGTLWAALGRIRKQREGPVL